MSISSNKSYKKKIRDRFNQLRKEGKSIHVTKSPYFGLIGSTTIEDIPYELQLQVKKEIAKEIFDEILEDSILSELEIIASPKIYEYRFKMEFVASFHPKFKPNNRFGQRKANSFDWVIDMQSCSLIKEKWFLKIRQIYDFIRENDIPNYDLKKHTGELRYLVLKEHNDEAMAIIVTKTTEFKEKIERAANLAVKLGFDSVYWAVNDSIGDTSEGEIVKGWGNTEILIKIKDKKFLVAPYTFFQNNIFAFQEIVAYVKKYLDNTERTKKLYDLYSGVGTLGIMLADLFQHIVGIEINEESVKLAEKNTNLNRITNATYHSQDLNVLDFKYINKYFDFNETLIVDPPRPGLQKNGIAHISLLKPKIIIYISCNPVSQANDIRTLIEKGYKPTRCKLFDLFPHTYHMESVVILEKK